MSGAAAQNHAKTFNRLQKVFVMLQMAKEHVHIQMMRNALKVCFDNNRIFRISRK